MRFDAMESTETMLRRLDIEFDRLLADMKPHVLQLSQKTGLFSICFAFCFG